MLALRRNSLGRDRIRLALICQPSKRASRQRYRNFRQADISVLILGEAHKPQNRRQFHINYELILSQILS